MSETHRNYLAIDLGASSGRALLGTLTDQELILHDVHRFENEPVWTANTLHWDALRLLHEIKRGLEAAAVVAGRRGLSGIGIDTWGVDFGLLGPDGDLLSNPVHYRDDRTQGVWEEAVRQIGPYPLFQRTAIHVLPLNTLFQLAAVNRKTPHLLKVASTLLLMPDLFNYFLTGERLAETTIASTTQFYDPVHKRWSDAVLEALELPRHILPPLVATGTVVGPLLPSVRQEVSVAGEGPPVIAVAEHDTASAVAAVPFEEEGSFYISSGTWSLMGVVLESPVINQEAFQYNLANEGAAFGAFRFQRNITGLWPLQECRRTWSREDGREIPWDELLTQAQQAAPFRSLVDPDDPSFLNPPDMPEAIRSYCLRTGQPLPEDRGQMVRCVLESLALRYRWVLDRIEAVIGERPGPVHIVGGGSRNALLSTFAASAMGRPVVCGPVEATAIGNVLVQAVATGQLSALEQGREIVRRSFPCTVYEPTNTAAWEAAHDRWQLLIEKPAEKPEKGDMHGRDARTA